MRKLSESGQALLLVLLSMAVVLTVVLSVVSRSVTDIAVSTKEEEALRAFSAAEAGVERALLSGSGGSGQFENASFTTKVTGTSSSVQEFAYPIGISSGESLIIWFINHDSNGNPTCTGNSCFTGSTLNVCWGTPLTPNNSPTTPAVEISIFYASNPSQLPADYSSTKIARLTADPYGLRTSSGDSGAPANKFTPAASSGCTIASTNYQFQTSVDFGAFGIPYSSPFGLLFAKIRMFYNTDVIHEVGVSAPIGKSLPPQGINIESTGIAGLLGTLNVPSRKVVVFQGYGEAPPIFDPTVFSPSGLVK